MEFGFAEVERGLAQLHRIAEDRRSAFSNRLRHLQKLGFPPGTNTGRGRRAGYRPEQIFLLACALELNQFGINPERAAHAVIAGLTPLAEGVFKASAVRSQTIWCNFSVMGLQDLMEDGVLVMHCLTMDELFGSMKRNKESVGRIAIFSVSRLVEALAQLIVPPMLHGEFREELREWARQSGGDAAAELEARFQEDDVARGNP